jgi:hypothetical protein
LASQARGQVDDLNFYAFPSSWQPSLLFSRGTIIRSSLDLQV